jgi:hypothetical protein
MSERTDPRIQHGGIDPLAASIIVRQARLFDKSLNIEAGVLPYGADVIHAGPPYRDMTDDHSWSMYVEYRFLFSGWASYAVSVEYASEDSRPCGIHWDGEFVVPRGLAATTGGYEERYQKWEKQLNVLGGPGTHTLRISRDQEPIPHIRTIKLELE